MCTTNSRREDAQEKRLILDCFEMHFAEDAKDGKMKTTERKKEPLSVTHPALAQEWDYERNAPLTPNAVMYGSGKTIWWICHDGHSWKSTINSRTNPNTRSGCPYCSGRRAIPGINDISTTNPEVINFWNYSRNKSINLSELSSGSNLKVWWICDKGHEWLARVADVSQGTRCPYCSGKRVLVGFNDLATINPEIAKEWNNEKNSPLTPYDMTAHSGKKVWWKGECGHEWDASVADRCNGRDCPYCSGRRVLVGFNDLATKNPEIAKEWNCEKNAPLTPYDVTEHSGKKVWWKGKCGHEWQTAIFDRTKGTGCPYCIGKKAISGVSDLKTWCIANHRENLLLEWLSEKNAPLTPEIVTIGSSKNVWWRCDKGHEWEATIASRTRKLSTQNYCGCPYCSGHRVWSGFNDIATTNPDVLDFWDYDKNVGIKPSSISIGADVKAWWRCDKGHTWKRTILEQCKDNICPYCLGRRVSVYRENEIECKICNRICEGIKGLSNHISQMHSQTITIKDYYDKYIKEPNEGVCPVCGKTTRFMGMRGYSQYCGLKCVSLDPVVRSKMNNTRITAPKLKSNCTSLAKAYPELIAEWDTTKNMPYTPYNTSSVSGRKAWWICDKGHSYDMGVNRRTKRNNSCPFCSGHRLLSGFNDFKTRCPEVAKEWHPTKNGELTPDKVTAYNDRKVWWLGKCGHEWEASVGNRAYGQGCPKCGFELHTSFAEQAIYFYLKRFFATVINSDRTILSGKELDIYIPSIKTAIEYDGYYHQKTRDRDKLKNQLCLQNGITLIRILEPSLKSFPDCICLRRNDTTSNSSLSEVINELLVLLKVENATINIDKDELQIRSLYVSRKEQNSLLALYPQIAAEWHPTKNGDLTPDKVTSNSHTQVWWKCNCGNEWQTQIAYRVQGKNPKPGCSKCKRKKANTVSVMCCETGQVFESIKIAEQMTNTKHISSCCRGVRQTAGGYHWKYVNLKRI